MKKGLSRLLTVVFFVLGLIHFYWAFGGLWSFEKVIPSNEQGIQVLSPTKTDSIIVGLALLSFGVFYLLFVDTYKTKVNARFHKFALWAIPIIFILRAIGDFNYVGFFKRIEATEFARLDSMLYSPLCLSIGLIGLYIIYKNKK